MAVAGAAACWWPRGLLMVMDNASWRQMRLGAGKAATTTYRAAASFKKKKGRKESVTLCFFVEFW